MRNTSYRKSETEEGVRLIPPKPLAPQSLTYLGPPIA